MISVEKNSELGKLGLDFLIFEKGFGMPNGDLNNCKVDFEDWGCLGIYVHFYDTGRIMNKKSQYYSKINSLLVKPKDF
jgi:hypothetical protein